MPPTVTPASPTGIHINAIMMLNSVASTENTIPVSYTHLGCANFVDDGSIVVYVNDRIGTVADVLNFLLGGLLYYIPPVSYTHLIADGSKESGPYGTILASCQPSPLS